MSLMKIKNFQPHLHVSHSHNVTRPAFGRNMHVSEFTQWNVHSFHSISCSCAVAAAPVLGHTWMSSPIAFNSPSSPPSGYHSNCCDYRNVVSARLPDVATVVCQLLHHSLRLYLHLSVKTLLSLPSQYCDQHPAVLP